MPQECLILTMRQNQKYFPLFDAAGKLTNNFLIVSNMRLADPKNIVEGNNRVVRPRLADARFFFETDKKTRLEARVPQLRNIVYHNKLGSQLERVERVQLLAGESRAAKSAPIRCWPSAPPGWPRPIWSPAWSASFRNCRASWAATTRWPTARTAQVADAIEQHYRPRFAGDQLPANEVAVALALADKLETLAGMFGIGQQPTGDKDPFALRRHAFGVIRHTH